MKVNMNQTPEKVPKAKSKGPVKSNEQANGGNVYAEGLKAYKDKWDSQIKGGELFRKNKFWIVICVILFIVFLSVNSNANNTKAQLTVKLRNLTTETAQLESVISDTKDKLEEQAKIDAIKLTEEQEELAKNSAVEKGVLVATLQNTYKTVTAANNRETFDANVNSLDVCFGNNDKNARTPWYGYHNYVPGTWEFASKASFVGNTAKVLWLCYADTDRTLLAYCTATYNADTQLFTNVEWKLTRYAEANIATDSAPTEAETGEITSVIDDIKSLVEDGTIEVPESDSDEISDSDVDLSDTRDQYKTAVENGEVEDETVDPQYNLGLNGSSESEEGDSDESISE